jgi:hypothetical protein
MVSFLLQDVVDVIKEEPHSDSDAQPLHLSGYCNAEKCHISEKCEEKLVSQTVPIMIKSEVSCFICSFYILFLTRFKYYSC